MRCGPSPSPRAAGRARPARRRAATAGWRRRTGVRRWPAPGRCSPLPPLAGERSPPCPRGGPSARREAPGSSPARRARRGPPRCARGRPGASRRGPPRRRRRAQADGESESGAARPWAGRDPGGAARRGRRWRSPRARRPPRRPARARTGRRSPRRPRGRADRRRSSSASSPLSAAATAPGTSTPASETPRRVGEGPCSAASARAVGGRTGSPQLPS